MPENLNRLKMWVGIITLIVTNTVTLVTSISAYTKEEKETTAKAAYAELSQAVSNISKENVALHKDVSNIRGYLAGLADKHRHERHEEKPKPKRLSYVQPQISIEEIPVEKEEDMEEPPPMKAKPAKYSPPNLDTLQHMQQLK